MYQRKAAVDTSDGITTKIFVEQLMDNQDDFHVQLSPYYAPWTRGTNPMQKSELRRLSVELKIRKMKHYMKAMSVAVLKYYMKN